MNAVLGWPLKQHKKTVYQSGSSSSFFESKAQRLLPSNTDTQKSLFEVEVFKFKAGQPVIWRASFFVAHRQNSESGLSVEIKQLTGNADFAGDNVLVQELSDGHDPRFDDVRRAYKSYVAIKDKTATVVMSFSRWFFEQASSRSQQLTTRNVVIGPVADCAFLEENRVTWSMADGVICVLISTSRLDSL